MHNRSSHYHRWLNHMHSLVLLAGMLLLLMTIGWLIAGTGGVIGSLAFGVIIILNVRLISPSLLLKLSRAQAIYYEQAPTLYQLLGQLSQQAGLSYRPRLYRLPAISLMAFTLGFKNDACIVLSDGLLHALNKRELAGVLAHEMSHIQHRDIWVMVLADIISRMTSLFSLVAYLLLIAYLPLLLIYEIKIPWLLFIFLLFAPTISSLMQLSLSRVREYNADLGAVALTNDPIGLISALKKIDQYQSGWLEMLGLPGQRLPDISLLRTHPSTGERVSRLFKVAEEQNLYGNEYHNE